LITATRKGELESFGAPKEGIAWAAVMAAMPARNSRRAMGVDMQKSSNVSDEGCQ
jgi:hypothetical protein